MGKSAIYEMGEPLVPEENPESIYYYIVAARNIQDNAFEFIRNHKALERATANATPEEITMLGVAAEWARDFIRALDNYTAEDADIESDHYRELINNI